jgi:hypothetical protein
LPQRSEENVGIAWIKSDIDAARVLVLVEDLVPGLAAVEGAENAAFRVRAVGMAERGDERDIRITRIDDDFADGAGVAQADVLPGFAAVQCLVDAVALRDVAAEAGFTRSDVQNVWIGNRYGEASNGGRAFLVED